MSTNYRKLLSEIDRKLQALDDIVTAKANETYKSAKHGKKADYIKQLKSTTYKQQYDDLNAKREKYQLQYEKSVEESKGQSMESTGKKMQPKFETAEEEKTMPAPKKTERQKIIMESIQEEVSKPKSGKKFQGIDLDQPSIFAPQLENVLDEFFGDKRVQSIMPKIKIAKKRQADGVETKEQVNQDCYEFLKTGLKNDKTLAGKLNPIINEKIQEKFGLELRSSSSSVSQKSLFGGKADDQISFGEFGQKFGQTSESKKIKKDFDDMMGQIGADTDEFGTGGQQIKPKFVMGEVPDNTARDLQRSLQNYAQNKKYSEKVHQKAQTILDSLSQSESASKVALSDLPNNNLRRKNDRSGLEYSAENQPDLDAFPQGRPPPRIRSLSEAASQQAVEQYIQELSSKYSLDTDQTQQLNDQLRIWDNYFQEGKQQRKYDKKVKQLADFVEQQMDKVKNPANYDVKGERIKLQNKDGKQISIAQMLVMMEKMAKDISNISGKMDPDDKISKKVTQVFSTHTSKKEPTTFKISQNSAFRLRQCC